LSTCAVAHAEIECIILNIVYCTQTADDIVDAPYVEYFTFTVKDAQFYSYSTSSPLQFLALA